MLKIKIKTDDIKIIFSAFNLDLFQLESEIILLKKWKTYLKEVTNEHVRNR